MKKRLILLILALPIFLMLSLFVVTKTVSLAVEVPVSGIEISGEKIVYLDLGKDEKYKIEYTVYPTNAKNQEVTFSTEAVGEERLAELEYTDGYIVPKAGGVAKVYLTTVDGGYKDSLIVFVESSGLESIESTVSNSSILVGEKIKISTNFLPAGAADLRLNYTSSNEGVAKVNAKGEIIGVGKGNAVITVSSEANSTVFDTIEINVYQDDPLALEKSELTTSKYEGGINISLKDDVNYVYAFKAYDEDGNELSEDEFSVTFDTTSWESGNVKMSYSCADKSYVGEITIVIYASYDGTTAETECKLTFSKEISASFDNGRFVVGAGQSAGATFTVKPDEADVTYDVKYSNGNVIGLMVVDGVVSFFAEKAGVTTVTLTVTDEESGDVKTATAEIVVTPKNFILKESGNTYGDENLFAVGGTEADGSDNKISLNLSYDASRAGEGFADKISFVTSAADVTLDKNGVVKIANGYVGRATVYGVFSYGDVEYKTPGFTIMCVGDGVNVKTFKELYNTVKAEKPVVLQGSVIEDFGYIDGAMYYTEDTVTKMHTTYDDTYYEKLGIEDKAVIKILLEFKNDIYGNGYTINANNVTMQLDSTGALKSDALFRGPLNFVSATGSESSAASVKAQDNVSFAIFDGVDVRNVRLYGCTLDADQNNQIDLTDLDYVGTTVEVFGDNVDIRYARIHNGRTVLRAFGDASDSSKVINVNISNSVLGGAREFIIRMGSNAIEDCESVADINNYVPTRLEGDPGLTFPVQKAYADLTDEEKAAYDAQFIKTFVNVENSVLTDAGIFAVGIDTHFSGSYLQQGGSSGSSYQSFMANWEDLAKTSYGAKLSFKGEVRMFCWKDVSTIDSSTLIECTEGFELADMLKFNVGELIDAVTVNESFKNIVYKKNEVSYVHAGITIFGGGRNYGVFDASGMNEGSQYSQLTGYEIGLRDAGRSFLELAAGKEKFYFMLHDATSAFLPENQDSVLKSENAYDCIYYQSAASN